MLQNMRFTFIFVLLLLVILNGEEDKKKQTESTPSPTELEVYTLCLDVNKITINNMQWDYGSDSRWAQTEGIVYVYNPEDSISTFKSLKFPIISDQISQESTNKDSSTSTPSQTLPTEFNFNDDEKSVGCWMEPEFHEINLRFKLYQFYHTALKAVSIVQIPPITSKQISATAALNTLPYQYSNANIQIDYTLTWDKEKVGLTPPIKPTTQIQPVKPPIDAKAQLDVEQMFDSDEVSDKIMTADQDDEGMQDEEQEDVVVPDHDNDDGLNETKQSPDTDWMFIAALCSSMLGLFVLVYICIWAYKSFGRMEYNKIPTVDRRHVSVGGNKKLGKVRKISLRNIGINNNDEERRNIMHPSVSYTFDE